ncbi:MAG: DUF305 domain-containing protein [Candidatus Saccharimonadales bacterium]
METKPLAFGIIGFLIGGLVVSVAATQLNKPNDTNSCDSSEMSMSQMTDDLKNKTGDDFDKAFISSMIEHHQGAIDMAKLAEKSAKHEEIKVMSNDIMTAQSTEIDMMKNWQTEWGYIDSSAGHDSMKHE